MDFTRVKREVTESRSIVQSIVLFISGLSEKLRAAKGNQAELDALADELDDQQAELARAIVSNTDSEEDAEVELEDLEAESDSDSESPLV